MIKERYADPLQEAMEIKAYDEEFANVAPSQFSIGMEMAFAHAAQTERAYNALMEQAGIAELNFYHTYGMTLTEAKKEADAGATDEPTADGKPGKFDKAKETVKNIWGKFIELLKRIKEALASAWKAVKQKLEDTAAANFLFYKKYSKQLDSVKDKEITIPGYKFENLLKKINFVGPANELKDKNPESNDLAENYANLFIKQIGIPGIAAPGQKKEQFATMCKNYFYGPKGNVTWKIGESLQIVKASKGIIKELNTDYVEANKAIDGFIKEAEKNKNKDNSEAIQPKIYMLKEASKRMQDVVNVRSKVVVDRIRQAKAVCVKALSDKTIFAGLDKIEKYQNDKASKLAGSKKTDTDIFKGLDKLHQKGQAQSTKLVDKNQKKAANALAKVKGPKNESALNSITLDDILSYEF